MNKAIQVKASQASRMIATAIRARIVPFLKGSPGCGKSQIVKSVADYYNLAVIDLRLSQCDPTDLLGFPTIVGQKADYMPMAHFPIVGDPLPEGKAGWLLFLDEANAAMPAIQAAAYKLVLDRMVGSHHLHPNVAIVLAGNLDTDGAITNPMSTALESRLLHLELVVDAQEWDKWAVPKGIDQRITSYINYKPGNLYTFSTQHTDCTFACPRTWEFADSLLKQMDISDTDLLPMLAGTISEGVAREFIGFCKIYLDLLKVPEIVANPEGVRVPQEPSKLWALSGSIAEHINPDNASALVKFIYRMPGEFQIVCLKESVRRNKEIQKNPAIREWITKSAAEFL